MKYFFKALCFFFTIVTTLIFVGFFQKLQEGYYYIFDKEKYKIVSKEHNDFSDYLI
jgi:hypothetical protein